MDDKTAQSAMADNATNSSPHGDLMVSINGEPFATRPAATHGDGGNVNVGLTQAAKCHQQIVVCMR